MLHEKTNKWYLLLILLLIAGTLVNIDFFGPPTLAAYFFYTIIGSFIALSVSIGFLRSKTSFDISNPLPLICLGLLSFYYLFNGLANGEGGINLRHYIIWTDTALLFSYCVLLSKGSINLIAVSKLILLLVLIECIICLLQQFSIVPSANNLFKVTGSNNNPNVTAMFLAMAVPTLLLVLFHSKRLFQILASISLLLCISSLVLLQCRSAFIGTTVGAALIINHEFQLVEKIKNRYGKVAIIISGGVGFVLAIIAFLFLYQSKKASSDGRMFIWKISLQAITQKPFFGSGYGQFEHDYNLQQAKYFASGNAAQQEILSADYVHMSYNEFLENLFEGGIIGLVLFIGFLIALLISTKANLDNTSSQLPKGVRLTKSDTINSNSFGNRFFAYAGIASFVVMSIFNFTVQALPVRAILILYAGVCCVHCKNVITFERIGIRKWNIFSISSFKDAILFKLGITAFTLFIFFKILTLSKAYHLCKTLLNSENELDNKETIQQMASMKIDLAQSTFYWRGYGNILMRTKHVDAAIEKYKNALVFSSNPDLYMDMGNCLSKRLRFDEAIKAYTIASFIEPHRFAPKFGLMKIYGFAKDTIHEKAIAQQIVDMKPKVESEKVDNYKKEAKKILENNELNQLAYGK